MNKIQAAYQKLGVAPGSSLDAVKKRYRQLAMVWHPDRIPTPEGRRTAEEELKQINNAFDCIKKHFESDHRQGPVCECQPVVHSPQGSGCQNTANEHGTGQSYSNRGGYQREKTPYEKWAEQEAREETIRRRRREEEAQEAALKEALARTRRAAEAQRAAEAAAAKTQVLVPNPPYTEQQLRWHVATGLAVIFVFLLIGGFNKRYEPKSDRQGDFSLSSHVDHLRPCPFLN